MTGSRPPRVPAGLFTAFGLVWLLASAPPLAAQTPPPTAAPTAPPAPCASAEHRQFDFWLGQWRVERADGRLAGHNRIESRHGGCVLTEHYSTPSGYSGESLNIYDARRGVWHQTWTDSGGLLLQLEGGRDGEDMLLQGTLLSPEGPVAQRIRWSPLADGSVRQLWQTRAAGAREWTTIFDGRYTRVAPDAAP